ncbi:SDR family NAD(P)-dependent oxidoreductase, partial [Streptomyces sp. WI04-05B]
TTALATAHTHHITTIDWAAFFGTASAPADVLPTYPFQRRSYWLPISGGGLGLGTSVLRSPEHPLLTAVVPVAEDGTVVLAGQLSLASVPWLTDHRVGGTAVVPSAALVDVALRAGRQAGAELLEELEAGAPLVVPETGAVELQVTVGAPDQDGRRAVAVFSRRHTPDDERDGGEPWTRHATGTLAEDDGAAVTVSAAAWPPPGDVRAVAVVHDRAERAGLVRGAALLGLRAAWRDGDTWYAEVELPEEADGDGYGIHPALLDAAAQLLDAAVADDAGDTDEAFRVPAVWTGVRLHAQGATRLRVTLTRTGPEAVWLVAADPAGVPVLSAAALAPGALPTALAAGHTKDLYHLAWLPHTEDGGTAPGSTGVIGHPADLDLLDEVPEVVLAPVPEDGGLQEVLGLTLDLVRRWVTDERFTGRRLAVVTRRAVAAGPGEHLADLAAAAVWGLVRSAQSEHPGRFRLVDVDGDIEVASGAHADSGLAAALASDAPQLAVRDGRLYEPRFAPFAPVAAPLPDGPWRLAVSGREPALLPDSKAGAPLAAGQVRVAVRAVALDADSLAAALSGQEPVGTEGSGVVLETGPEVTGLTPGDRVMGLLPEGAGLTSVTDRRLLAPVPADWTFAEAAAAVLAFLGADEDGEPAPGGDRPLDVLRERGPARTGERLAALAELFAGGGIGPLPVTAFDVREAADAVAGLDSAGPAGTVVLTVTPRLDPEGTVLITGGTGTLGAHLARHLVTTHGARHLLLIGRRGPDAPGATQLAEELRTHGAHVTITACDAGDPDDLTRLLADIPDDHPLTAVFHTAGTADNAPVEELTADQLAGVVRGKAEAAHHLHLLTRSADLAAFVLYSSIGGLLGNPGQANYAAANVHLDALAHLRRSQGLPATSLSWPLWLETSGITGQMDQAQLDVVGRLGLTPLTSARGLELLDAALEHRAPALIPVRVDTARLRALPVAPLLLRALVRTPRRATASGDARPALAERVAGLAAEERDAIVLAAVTTTVADVLGHTHEDSVGTRHSFKELGFDSLTAVEFRNRLSAATGLSLSATLVYDHPTPAALAAHVAGQLAPARPPTDAMAELERLEAAVAQLPADAADRGALGRRLQALVRTLSGTTTHEADGDLDSATDDELFEALNSELGVS